MHISKLSCFAFFAAVVYAIPTTEGNAGGLSKRAPELPPPLPGPKGYPENFWKGSRHGARPDDPTYPYRKRRGRMSPEAAAAVDDLEECIDEQWREWVNVSSGPLSSLPNTPPARRHTQTHTCGLGPSLGEPKKTSQVLTRVRPRPVGHHVAPIIGLDYAKGL